MGRGVSSGGGQSSLGYLFGSGEAPKPATTNAEASQNNGANNVPPPKVVTAPVAAPPAPQVDASKQIPAGIPGNKANNYFRADGQNTGNFITDGLMKACNEAATKNNIYTMCGITERPSTKVHSAPGGGSSLDYLFGGGSK